MRRKKGQLNEMESILWFMPEHYSRKEIVPTDNDWTAYFLKSERGEEPTKNTDGYIALEEGRRWRQVHVGMYEEGILDGSIPYVVILEDMPEAVMRFMARSMFKGIDKDVIEMCWKNILKK